MEQKNHFTFINLLETIIVILIVAVIITGITNGTTVPKNEKKHSSTDYSENTDNEEDEYENLSYSEKQNLQRTKFYELNQNITMKYLGIDTQNRFMVEVQNNNDDPIDDIYLYIVLYDENKKPIHILKDKIMHIESASKYYCLIDNTNDYEYSSFDLFIDKEYFYENDYQFYNDKITYEFENNGTEVKVSGKNISKNKIKNVIFSVIFYDENDNVLGIEEIREYDISKGSDFVTRETYLLDRTTYKKIPYSKVEVYLNEAYSY